MIIWTGVGFLAAVIPIALMILAEKAFGQPAWQANDLLKALVFVVSAAAVWIIGTKLNSSQGRILLDEKTGQRIQLKRKHSLFFIRMEYWAFLLAVLALLAGLGVIGH